MDHKEFADVLPLLKQGSVIEYVDAENNVNKQWRIQGLVQPVNEFSLVVHTMDGVSGALLEIPKLAQRVREGTARIVEAKKPQPAVSVRH